MIERIDHYDIRFEIGRGGFGCVYLGFDPRVERLVAIKVLTAKDDESLTVRFRTEAAAAGNLRHRNIVTVYGSGEDNGQQYLVMEYLDGQTLQQLMQKAKPLSILQQVDILVQMAEGLACAHQNGVVHRDVKPANVMVLRDGTVKIMDFGIARLVHDKEKTERLTNPGMLLGTVPYMAPEQFNGVEVDALCDIWAFGVIAYELLTGQHPFSSSDSRATIFRIMRSDPDPPSSLAPALPPPLERVIVRLLERDREARYQSFEDACFDLRPILVELRKQEALALLPKAAALVAAGTLEEANSLVRAILAMDAANEQARGLHRKIREGIAQRTIRSRVAALVTRAQEEAAKRSYATALDVVESALKLAPADPDLVRCRETWRQQQALIARSEELTRQARSELSALNLTAAFAAASLAVQSDPENQPAQELLLQVRNAQEVRQRRREFQEQLGKVEVLLEIGDLDDAAALLDQLAGADPNSHEVHVLQSRYGFERTARERQQRFSRDMRAVRQLLNRGAAAEAVSTLQVVMRDFPLEREAADLLQQATTQVEEQQRRQVLAECEAACREAQVCLDRQDFDRAREGLQQALLQYPGETLLLFSLDKVRRAQAEREMQVRRENALTLCRELREQGNLEEARNRLQEVVREFGESPQASQERSTLDAAVAEHDRQRQREQARQDAVHELRLGKATTAIEIMRAAEKSLGADDQLRELLARASEVEEEMARNMGRSAALAAAKALEASGDWARALTALEEARAKFGTDTALEAEVLLVEQQVHIDRWKTLIRHCAANRNWLEARKHINTAHTAYPGERPVWAGFIQQVEAGQTEDEIARLLDSGDLEGAGEMLQAAVAAYGAGSALDALERRLRDHQFRGEAYERAQTLAAQEDYTGAEAALHEVLRQSPSDAVALALLSQYRQGREQKDHDSYVAGRCREAANLADQHQYGAAIDILRALLKKTGPSEAVTRQLEAVRQAQSDAERAAKLAEGRRKLEDLAAQSEFDGAIRLAKGLNKQFPEADFGERLLQLQQAQVEDSQRRAQARQAQAEERQRQERTQLEARKQEARIQARRKAQDLLQAGKFNAAIGLLRPMLEETPGDRDLQGMWRVATSGKGQKLGWLEIYEEMTELEALFQKGKADRVQQRAARLLEQVEQPRARELLVWAEAELAKKPRRRFL